MKTNKWMFLFIVLFTSQSFAGFTLKFIADVNWPTSLTYQGVQVGGLSGLIYDDQTKTMLAISDDRSEHANARFYTLHVDVTEKSFVPTILGYTDLRDTNGAVFQKNTVDPEAITVYRYPKVLFTSEGVGTSNPRIMPGVFAFDVSKDISSSVPIPNKFLPELTGTQTKGTRSNLAFESLSITKDRSWLYTANEEPLMQDDDVPSATKGGYIRILEYSLTKKPLKPGKEYVYALEAVPNQTGLKSILGENGLSEMIALGRQMFLTLERAYVVQTDKVTARIFAVSCKQATDVSAVESLRTAKSKIALCQKKLVLDFDDVLSQLSPGFQSIDNLEGMTFGPTLPNGHASFILVSDNNFSGTQRTQFLAFEVVPDKNL